MPFAALLPFLLGGVSVLGGFMQMRAMDEAADRQQAAAEANAQAERLETEESVRRLEREKERNLAAARARAAAGGTDPNVGIDVYLQDLATEYQREIDWMKKAGESRARVTSMSGAATSSATRASGQGAFLGGLSSGGQFLLG